MRDTFVLSSPNIFDALITFFSAARPPGAGAQTPRPSPLLSCALKVSRQTHWPHCLADTTHALSPVNLLGARLRGFSRALFFAPSIRAAGYSQPNLASGLLVSWGTPVALHMYGPRERDQPGSESLKGSFSGPDWRVRVSGFVPAPGQLWDWDRWGGSGHFVQGQASFSTRREQSRRTLETERTHRISGDCFPWLKGKTKCLWRLLVGDGARHGVGATCCRSFETGHEKHWSGRKKNISIIPLSTWIWSSKDQVREKNSSPCTPSEGRVRAEGAQSPPPNEHTFLGT